MPNPEHNQPTIDRVAREVVGALGDILCNDAHSLFAVMHGTEDATWSTYSDYLSDHRTAARVLVYLHKTYSTLKVEAGLDTYIWDIEIENGIHAFMLDAWADPLGSIIELWRVVGEEA